MGVTSVSETAAETLPMKKSIRKWLFSAGAATETGEAFVATVDKSTVVIHAGTWQVDGRFHHKS